MKFIHAADLHIESPYRGIRSMNVDLGKALLEYGIRAYEKLIDTCVDAEVDFLLIAGDSFDSESGSLSAQYRFFRGLERLNSKGIKAYIICGNHDPLNQWAKNFKLPENVVLFGPDEVQKHIFSKEGQDLAAIYGVSFGEKVENRRLVQQYKRNDNTLFSIGILHGTLAGREHQNPYCPFTMDELRASKMDYFALGHIHKSEIVHDSNPLVVYSGNIQGRHFNETGDKGCYLIEVEKGKVTSKRFISLSDVVFEYIQKDISEIKTITALFEMLEDLRNELISTGKSSMLRIELTGMSEIYEVLTNQKELDELIVTFNNDNNYNMTFVFLDRIINQAMPVIDLEDRKLSSDFIGDLIRRFEVYEKDDEQLLEMQKELLEEIKSTKVGRYINEIENLDEMKEVLNRAKWKCISGLITKTDDK